MDGDSKEPESVVTELNVSSEHQMHSTEDFGNHEIEDEFHGTSEVVSDYPLDLRTTKLTSPLEVSKPTLYLKKDKKEVISIAELLENFYYDETFVNHHSSSKLLEGNNYPRGFEINNSEVSQCSNMPADYSVYPQIHSQMKYESCGTSSNSEERWNIGTNTEPILVTDSGTQTVVKETVDTSIQTDLAAEVITHSMVRNLQKSYVKFTCSICRRIYASKSSYDRHLRTHVVYTNHKKITSSVLFTEAKLELYKKKETRKYQSEPIIIQMPRTNNLQCEYCKQFFKTQKEKYGHFQDCIIEPFFMTKCPECSIKFYTLECLNRHIGLVHKKPTSTYFCIFCDENFDSGYTFQLHLEKHLSP